MAAYDCNLPLKRLHEERKLDKFGWNGFSCAYSNICNYIQITFVCFNWICAKM